MEVVSSINKLNRFDSNSGLDRMKALLELLDNPEKDLKVIHVAGTNGKGSICMYLYEILREEGYSVGLYTSPFLEIFNERIQIDGRMISDSELEKYYKIVHSKIPLLKEMGFDEPIEFEMITAIAFLFYKEQKVDYLVLEVGLGGRLDATNVIEKSLVSVIASISYDHTERLGSTLELIAKEKAGIIKEGCPVVTSCRGEGPLNVIKDKAKSLNCPFFSTRNIPFIIKYETINGSRFDVKIKDKNYIDLEISMVGRHQIENAICSISVVQYLIESGIEIKDSSIYKGLKRAKQIGRYEVLCKEPLLIIDGAHNPDGARTLKETTQNILRGKKVLIVCGMLSDKDSDKAVIEFTKVSKDFIVTTVPSSRKMDPNELANKIENLGRNTYVVPDPKEAVLLADEMSKSFDATIYCGSLYLIGFVRKLLRGK